MIGAPRATEVPAQNCASCGKTVIALDSLGVPHIRTRIVRVTEHGGMAKCRFCKAWFDVPIALTRKILPLNAVQPAAAGGG